MKIKVTINGKEIEAEISQEELNKLQTTVKEKKKIGYERVKQGAIHYYVDFIGEATDDYDDHNIWNDKTYDIANYYSDKTVAQNNARTDKLMRQLRRFAVEHRETELDWNDSRQYKYFIFYNHVDKRLTVDSWRSIQPLSAMYFDSEQTANLAIDTFRDELIWYFTEYKDSL